MQPGSLIKAVSFVIVFFVGVMLIQSVFGLFGRTEPVADLNYGELIRQAEAGNIASVTIESDGSVQGEFKDAAGANKRFRSALLRLSMKDIESLSTMIRDKNPDARIKIKNSDSSAFNILLNWLPVILIIGFGWWLFSRRMTQGMGQINSFARSRAKLYKDYDKKTFADVAGAEEAKEELQEVVEFLKNPGKFTSIGARIPKGILLMGPPGTGKTLLAKAVAGESNVPFFSISGSDFVEMFVGVGASRVRDLFEQGKKNAPCIIFIDEIDAVGRHRGTGLGGGHDEKEQTLNQMLSEMDGFESNNGVIVIAATNRPDILDPALLRPGRFDRRVVIDKPDIKGRLGILRVHSKNVPTDDNVDLSVIARGTPGFTGADLADLVNEAAIKAAQENSKTVQNRHLEMAKDKILMGAERRSVVISEEEKRITAYHETGHAVVASFIPEADPVHKVTIIPRGMSLGATHQLPIDDKHNFSDVYLKSRLAVLMGGRIAEEIFIGTITTGAGNDIEVATELARRMVCEWGMSSKLGPVKYGAQSHNLFLGKKMSESIPDYSEETARQVDAEIKALIDEGAQTARKILGEKRGLTDIMVQKLIEKEVLDAEEVKQLTRSV